MLRRGSRERPNLRRSAVLDWTVLTNETCQELREESVTPGSRQSTTTCFLKPNSLQRSMPMRESMGPVPHVPRDDCRPGHQDGKAEHVEYSSVSVCKTPRAEIRCKVSLRRQHSILPR